MHFNDPEKQLLLALKGVGATVVQRLESMGFSSLAQLAEADAQDILSRGAALTGSTCWRNSPLARKAIQAAVEAAVVHASQHRCAATSVAPPGTPLGTPLDAPPDTLCGTTASTP